MYLNRRSCTASKAQLQSEKEKGETVERRGRGGLGDVELLPCLFARLGRRERGQGLPSTLSPGQLRSCSTRRFTFVPDGNGNVSKTPSLNLFNYPRVATPFWSSRVSPNLSMGAWILNGRDGEKVGKKGWIFIRAQRCAMSDLERTNVRR